MKDDPNRLRAELIEFADKGCMTPFEAECQTQFPDHPNEWCFACLATAVIEWHHEELEHRLLAAAALGAPPPAAPSPNLCAEWSRSGHACQEIIGVMRRSSELLAQNNALKLELARVKTDAMPIQLRSAVIGVLEAYGHHELAAAVEGTLLVAGAVFSRPPRDETETR